MEQWEEGGEGVGEEEGRERGLRGKQEECAGGVWGKIQNSHLAAKMKQHTHTLSHSHPYSLPLGDSVVVQRLLYTEQFLGMVECSRT